MTTRKVSRRQFVGGAAAVGAGAALSPTSPATAVAGAGEGGEAFSATRTTAHNVRAVGYSDLDGRGGGFKLAIQEVAGRWYLYMGHLWHRGWSILDVTDPRQPEVLNFIEGPANTWTIQMDVEDNLMITSLEQMPASWGGDPSAPFDEGVLIWDLADDPVHPRLLGHFRTEGSGTHRNGYPGGRYVHLAAGMPGFSRNIYVIIDIDDPTNPVEVGRWWVPGQHEAGGETPESGVSLHGPPFVVGDLAYLPYGAAGLVIVDISDVTSPQFVGQLDFSPPFNPNIGVHSVLPLVDRGIAVANSEAIAVRGMEPLNHTSTVDISDPANPTLLATFPVPDPPRGAPFPTFHDRGGRFGPHNTNMLYHSPFTDHSDDRIYLAYFNAGLRIYDIGDPRTTPEEVGYFMPPDPTERFGPQPPDALVLQAEDVLVDTRGYIYLSNKNQGLWILRETGR
ncbi:MAG: hypothetical protein GEU93_12895 [Propionibacteriales bacterium]|nr:hypothetical protein [Propionibacteriales bacterium]